MLVIVVILIIILTVSLGFNFYVYHNLYSCNWSPTWGGCEWRYDFSKLKPYMEYARIYP